MDNNNYKNKGIQFDGLSLYHTKFNDTVNETPKTFMAYLCLDASNKNGGTVYGNFHGLKQNLPSLRFGVEDGHPMLCYFNKKKKCKFVFDEVVIPNGEWLCIAITDDIINGVATCYINNKVAQQIHMTDEQISFTREAWHIEMCIGGDFYGGTNHFEGRIKAIAVFNEVEDISAINLDHAVSSLISFYELPDGIMPNKIKDQVGGHDVLNNRMNGEWVKKISYPIWMNLIIQLQF